jgi:rod shape-determining protein MreD
VRVFWTALALLLALGIETGLSQLAPSLARLLDPFLIVLVYCGLLGGEVHGMLAGAAGGWVQDVLFGGRVLGMGALSKLLVGFGVGVAGARFHLAEPVPRVLVVLLATILDALIIGRLSAAFDVPAMGLALPALLGRAVLNALFGALAFALVERWFRRPLKREHGAGA